MLSLLSSTSRVETPFIIATIAGYTFGAYSRDVRDLIKSSNLSTASVVYPNYMKSLVVEKLNGTVNTYTLTMMYIIREGNDPNLLEKVFSAAKDDRTIKLSYGDLSLPTYIYKEEEAIITNIKTNISIETSTLTYVITATSSCYQLAAGTFSFRKKVAKPSDIIKEILFNTKYGVQEVFYGMRDKEKVLSRNLIMSDDREVTIEAKSNISIFNYLSYLVKCMSNKKDTNNSILTTKYALVVFDDIDNIWNGPYFKIIKVDSDINENTLDTYQIDIGYPGTSYVTGFSIDDDQAYSLLLDYSEKIEQPQYIYSIDNQGNIIGEYSPALAKSNTLLKTTQAEKNWWTQVTQFPITGRVTIKGLLRPAILMTNVKLNVLFYGRQHISSGYYIVTKQTDTINDAGYRTELKLTRVQRSD